MRLRGEKHPLDRSEAAGLRCAPRGRSNLPRRSLDDDFLERLVHAENDLVAARRGKVASEHAANCSGAHDGDSGHGFSPFLKIQVMNDNSKPRISPPLNPGGRPSLCMVNCQF
jgi:hypothetical protein